jgi:hypothetical protein
MSKQLKKPLDALGEMDAGIFLDKVGRGLSDAGKAAIAHGKQAKVVLELTFKQLSNTQQCDVSHKIKTEIPHATGKTIDEDTKSTPMYIHTDGNISVFSEEQHHFDFSKAEKSE